MHENAFSPDRFLRQLFGYPPPQRNDCGYARRFDYEDTSRMHGWGPEEGEGPCDYPEFCPHLRENGQCPFFLLVGLRRDIVARKTDTDVRTP